MSGHARAVLHLMGHGELFVVETDDDVLLGTVELRATGRSATVIVRSGYVGRPVVLDADTVVRMTPASEHPDVLGFMDTVVVGGAALPGGQPDVVT